MDIEYLKQYVLAKRQIPCRYCKTGIGQFAGLEKYHNDIDDVEMGFPEVYYAPNYQCDSCKTTWGAFF